MIAPEWWTLKTYLRPKWRVTGNSVKIVINFPSTYLKPRPHVSGFFWKRNFFLRIGLPSTRKRWNGHRKRNFSKTVSKVELFENSVFLFSFFKKRIKKRVDKALNQGQTAIINFVNCYSSFVKYAIQPK